MNQDKLRVLFLCTGNSCRSQMAEGWTKYLKGDVIEAASAGLTPKGVDPRAVKVMSEVGIDISSHTSKSMDDLPGELDVVVTVCGHANENCPFFSGAPRVVHVGFEDPPRLVEGIEDEEEALTHYRRVRDEIRAFVETLPDSIL